MRLLLLPLSVLVVATAAADTWVDVIKETYGPCAASCVIAAFEDSQVGCGDPDTVSSTKCFCDKYASIQEGLVYDEKYSSCFKKCNLAPQDVFPVELSENGGEICSKFAPSPFDESTSSATTSTRTASVTTTKVISVTEATTSTTADTSTTTATTVTPTASESPSATPDAGSTLSSSKAAFLAGVLAFLGYAL